METNLNNCSLISLTDEEQKAFCGGSPWIIFGAVVMVLGLVNSLAFGVGYVAGTIAANLEE